MTGIAFLTVALVLPYVSSFRWNDVNLPPEHLAMFFNQYPELAERCEKDVNCPFDVS